MHEPIATIVAYDGISVDLVDKGSKRMTQKFKSSSEGGQLFRFPRLADGLVGDVDSRSAVFLTDTETSFFRYRCKQLRRRL